MMSRELRFIHKTVHMGGREKEYKEGAKDEEEKEDAEERAVKEDSERPSWREGVHEEEEREQALSSGIANRQGRDHPDKGRPMWTKLVSIGRSLHIRSDGETKLASHEDHGYLDTVVQVPLNRLMYVHTREHKQYTLILVSTKKEGSQ
jgi:hypothetical protein